MTSPLEKQNVYKEQIKALTSAYKATLGLFSFSFDEVTVRRINMLYAIMDYVRTKTNSSTIVIMKQDFIDQCALRGVEDFTDVDVYVVYYTFLKHISGYKSSLSKKPFSADSVYVWFTLTKK